MGCEPKVKEKGKIHKLYGDLIPLKWSSKFFLSKGVLPGGLPPNFFVKNLYEAYRDAKVNSKLVEAEKGYRSSLIDFTFPRPGVKKRRRTAFLVNPVQLLLTNRAIKENWKWIRRHLSEKIENSLETSTLIKDSYGLRYLVTAFTHTKLEGIANEVRVCLPYQLHLDIQSFYPSFYTHALEWAFVGKENAKSGCSNCSKTMYAIYKASQALDKVVRNAQSAETYGLPIGPDHALLLAEVLGKRITRDFVNELGKNLRGDFYVIRHVDDFRLFLKNKQDVRLATNLFRKILRIYNLQPNELKIAEVLPSDPSRATWLIELASFSTKSDVNEMKLSKSANTGSIHLLEQYLQKIGYIGKGDDVKIQYQIIDGWELVNYVSIIKKLQVENPEKSVITYGLRRLHFNVFVNPLKGIGRPYLMNFSPRFFAVLDSELAKLLIAFPEYVDVIGDVYLWYSFYYGSFNKEPATHTLSYPFLREAIIHVLSVLDANGEHFETSWTLWLAACYRMPLTDALLNKLAENIKHPITALSYLNYLFATLGDSSEARDYAKKLSDELRTVVAGETGFSTTNWLLLYSIWRSPWKWLRDIWKQEISEIQSDDFGSLLHSLSVDFFSWMCKGCKRTLSPVQQALGLSRKGRGGVTARTYLT